MKVLFIGDSPSEQYVKAFYENCKKYNGIIASLFSYGVLRKKSFFTRFEMHFKNGLLIFGLNRRLINECKREQYDLVFVYYSTILYGKTIKKIHESGCKVFMYCNDNPFACKYKSYIWRHFKKQIPYYDIIYSYRNSNIDDYLSFGAKKTELMMPYYIATRNYFVPDENIDFDVPEVVFIGHNESDGREEYIKKVLEYGICVGLNPSWKRISAGYPNAIILPYNITVSRYNETINKAKIAIVFLSKLNEDTYTRRCFEIPATKTLMLAPYTDELASIYRENYEIVFYRDIDEFLMKIKYYLSHDIERERIGENGYCRLMNNKDEAGDRIETELADYKALLGDAEVSDRNEKA